MFYFAYGSNMSSRRLRQRVPSARPVGTAALAGHRLSFRKIGRDGSGKCDIVDTGLLDDVAWGVLFRIEPQHRPALDAAEDLGRGYALRQVDVAGVDGGLISAFTYAALRVDESLQPFDWYREHVLRGAREHGLPRPYVAAIEAIIAVADADPVRQARERSVHRTAQ